MLDDEELLRYAYAAFNARNVDAALATMHPEVEWPNAMEGGTVHGYQGVREYWTREWTLFDLHVEPLSFARTPDGRMAVEVRQVLRNTAGAVLLSQLVHHIFRIEGRLIREMEVRIAPTKL